MTRILLEEYGYINIEEGTNFPLTFNVQDVAKPSSTSSSYSKDIIIIGDKETNKIFNHAYDVNIQTTSFNVNKKVSCQVIQDGASVFENAFFQLLSVEKLGDRIKYTGRVKSNLLNFFTELKNKELTDLKLFNNPIELNPTNIKTTYDNDYNDGWKFVPHFTDRNVINVSNFKPGVFLRKYWDAIHEMNGFSYELDQAEELFFNDLIIPSTSKWEPDQNEIDRLTVKAEQGVDGHAYVYQNTPSNKWLQIPNDPSDGERNRQYFISNSELTKDEANQWNGTSTQQFTPYSTDNFKFRFDVDIDTSLIHSSGEDCAFMASREENFDQLENRVYVETFMRIEDLEGERYYSNSVYEEIGSYIRVNNTLTAIDKFPDGTTLLGNQKVTLEMEIPVSAGNRLRNLKICSRVRTKNDGYGYFRKVNDDSAGAQLFTINNNINSMNFSIVPEGTYAWGVPVYLNKFVPKSIKQRDFIKSIMTMFNLIVEVDPSEPYKLIYKTRDKFYDDGEEKNWTKKIEDEKPHKLEWIQNKQPKNLTLTYKEDEDINNKTYESVTKETYGEYEFTFENEYNIGDESEELIFSPTPIVRSDATGMFLPAISAEPENKYNIRILLDAGKLEGNWYFQNQDGTAGDREEEYPFITHINDPFNPSFDLNFGPCAFYYIDTFENPTQNNLFNLFHRRRFSQLSKGKILTAYFKLTPTDILNFKLNDKIFVDDALYNVNKIIDYNANKPSLTKVELITVDEGQETLPTPIIRTIGPYTPAPTTPPVINTGIGGATPAGTGVKTDTEIKGTGNVVNDAGITTTSTTTKDSTTSRDTETTSTGRSSLEVSGDNNNIANYNTNHQSVKGNDNKLNTRQSIDVKGNKNEVTQTKTPSMIIGNDNTNTREGARLIVGDNLKPLQEADIATRVIQSEEVKINQLDITEDAITKTIKYVEDGYVEEDYVEEDIYFVNIEDLTTQDIHIDFRLSNVADLIVYKDMKVFAIEGAGNIFINGVSYDFNTIIEKGDIMTVTSNSKGLVTVKGLLL